MGFEKMIYVKLTERLRNEIQSFILKEEDFVRINHYENRFLIEFKNSQNGSDTPDVIVELEVDGIYICQLVTSVVWGGLEE